ncbi:MAG: T9SS type A sorting domain-containing protein [Salinivenus sp.]
MPRSTPLSLYRIAGGITFGAFLFLIGGFAGLVQAQPETYSVQKHAPPDGLREGTWKDCGLRKEDIDTFTSIRPAPAPKRAATANIEVDYSGFSSEARVAFQRAVETWERHIKSDVTIRIDASFESRDPRVLGGTTPNFVYAVDEDEDGEFEFSVNDALLDALAGEDRKPSEPDMFVTLNSERNDWHFGEGDAPSGQIDFTSVVLHEITHGLGYFESTGVSGREGEYGVDFSGSDGPVPYVYTKFLVEQDAGSEVPLTDESEFPNPSEALGDALTGNMLVFDGPGTGATATIGSGPVPPRIYAPSEYDLGSSVSHLDEETYPSRSRDALMTPFVNTAETNRLPGPIVCGQLNDMGWPLGNGCQRYFSDVFALQFAGTPDPTTGSVTLDWTVREDTTINEFVVERNAFDGAFGPVKQVSGPPVTVDSLGLGIFTFRVRWTKSDGSEATTATTVQADFRTQNVTSEITGRGDQGRASVRLSWDVPPGTEGFTYQIERRAGASGEFTEVASSVDQREFTLSRQTPGAYAYRVSASDGDNTVEGEQIADVNISFDGDVYALGPYPNPVRNIATLDLTARTEQSVTVEAYDVVGKRVYSETRSVGTQAPESVMVNTRGWSSGMYFLRVRGDKFTKTRKMVVVK